MLNNYDIEYERYCIKCLCMSLEDKIDNKILTKEEFIREIESCNIK